MATLPVKFVAPVEDMRMKFKNVAAGLNYLNSLGEVHDDGYIHGCGPVPYRGLLLTTPL